MAADCRQRVTTAAATGGAGPPGPGAAAARAPRAAWLATLCARALPCGGGR